MKEVIILKKRIGISALLTIIILTLVTYIAFEKKDQIYIFYRDNILKVKENITINKNEYYKNTDYKYVKNTNDFVAKNKQHLLDIFYTIINSGETKFTFYCDNSYKNCLNDVVKIANDQTILSSINNYVHPYNSFEKIYTTYSEYKEIEVNIDKTYNQEEINTINQKVDQILQSELKPNMTDKEKIKKIHNYIINHGKYVPDKDAKTNNYSKANNILLDGYGLCSAYSDAMAIFLNKLNINNYKIASDTHVWNLVNLNKEWLHLDLTWDDPVTSDGSDRLEEIFLLITDKRLKQLNVNQHNYDKNIYMELK